MNYHPQKQKHFMSLPKKVISWPVEKRYEEAILATQEAMKRIPEPWQKYAEAISCLAVIGDYYRLMGKHPQAIHFLEESLRLWNLSGMTDPNYPRNPYTLLSLGEIFYEMGERKKAFEYLHEAWLLEGDEIFEIRVEPYNRIDHKKYFDFLK